MAIFGFYWLKSCKNTFLCNLPRCRKFGLKFVHNSQSLGRDYGGMKGEGRRINGCSAELEIMADFLRKSEEKGVFG